MKEAPEPSNIMWEHLDTPWIERACRQLVTAFLSILLLVASFAVILYAQTNKEVLQCPEQHTLRHCSSFSWSADLCVAAAYCCCLLQLFAAVIPDESLCTTHLPANLYGQYFDVAAPEIVRDFTYVVTLVPLYMNVTQSRRYLLSRTHCPPVPVPARTPVMPI